MNTSKCTKGQECPCGGGFRLGGGNRSRSQRTWVVRTKQYQAAMSDENADMGDGSD